MTNLRDHIIEWLESFAAAQRQAGRKEAQSAWVRVLDKKYAALVVAARVVLVAHNDCTADWESKEGEPMTCDEVANLSDEDRCPLCRLGKALSDLDEAKGGK